MPWVVVHHSVNSASRTRGPRGSTRSRFGEPYWGLGEQGSRGPWSCHDRNRTAPLLLRIIGAPQLTGFAKFSEASIMGRIEGSFMGGIPYLHLGKVR